MKGRANCGRIQHDHPVIYTLSLSLHPILTLCCIAAAAPLVFYSSSPLVRHPLLFYLSLSTAGPSLGRYTVARNERGGGKKRAPMQLDSVPPLSSLPTDTFDRPSNPLHLFFILIFEQTATSRRERDAQCQVSGADLFPSVRPKSAIITILFVIILDVGNAIDFQAQLIES